MQHQHYAQARLSRPAYLILASLAQEPKHAIALQEVIEQAEGLYIEPGTLYRVLAQLEQRGWIEALTIEQPLRLYPLAWRERYEAEMVALLEQHQITLWTVLDLLVGAIAAFVAFWIALLPWFWLSLLGIGPDTQCAQWRNNYALCRVRVTVGMHAPSLAQTLVGALLGAIPLLLMAFLAILVLARGKKASTHLLLVLPVTIGMLVLCLACAGWLYALWPLLPQISQFYPQATAGLLSGLAGMGLATVLALGSLSRAAFALRALSTASPRQESHPFSPDQQASEAAQDTCTPHLERPTVSASRSKASRVPKRWGVALVALLLLFAFPLPLLVPPDGPDLLFYSSSCSLPSSCTLACPC